MSNTRGGQRKSLGKRAGERAAADELAELEELLASAGVSEEVRRAMKDGNDPQAVLHHLVEVGILPSPEESLTELLAGWKPLLEPGADPLSAELTGTEFLGVLREAAPAQDEFPALLATLVEHAGSSRMPEALAMLRVLAVLGPHEVRPEAAGRRTGSAKQSSTGSPLGLLRRVAFRKDDVERSTRQRPVGPRLRVGQRQRRSVVVAHPAVATAVGGVQHEVAGRFRGPLRCSVQAVDRIDVRRLRGIVPVPALTHDLRPVVRDRRMREPDHMAQLVGGDLELHEGAQAIHRVAVEGN